MKRTHFTGRVVNLILLALVVIWSIPIIGCSSLAEPRICAHSGGGRCSPPRNHDFRQLSAGFRGSQPYVH